MVNSYKYELLFKMIDEGTAPIATATRGVKAMKQELATMAPNSSEFAGMNSQLRQTENYLRGITTQGKTAHTSFKDLHSSSEAMRGTMEKLEKVSKFALAFLGLHEGVRLFRALHNEIMSFAKDHATTADTAMRHYEEGMNHFFTVLVNSKAFKATIEFIASAFDFVAVLMEGKETWDNFLIWLMSSIMYSGHWIEEMFFHLWKTTLYDVPIDYVKGFVQIQKDMLLGNAEAILQDNENMLNEMKNDYLNFVPSDALVMEHMNLNNKLLDLQKSFNKEKAELPLSNSKSENEKSQKELEDKLKKEGDELRKSWERDNADLVAQNHRQAEIEQMNLETRARMGDFYADIARKQAQVERDDFIAMEQSKKDALMGIMGNLATFMNSKNKELFAIGKAAAIASAIVDTYAAANKALRATPIPALNIALAASIIAVGLANVAKIASTHMGGSGGGGGSSSGGGTSGGGGQRNYNSTNDQSVTNNYFVFKTLKMADLRDSGIAVDFVDSMQAELDKRKTLDTTVMFGRG